MATSKISIVIPTYNRAGFLREAISSALAQTCSDFELIIGDDASSDHTPDVVAEFKDPRIRYFRHENNIGITPNWQFVVNQARAYLVAPLADDDLFLPEHLSMALDVLEHHQLVAYHTCPAEYFGDPIALGYYRPVALSDTISPLIHCVPTDAVRFLGTDNPGPLELHGMPHACNQARVLGAAGLYPSGSVSDDAAHGARRLCV